MTNRNYYASICVIGIRSNHFHSQSIRLIIVRVNRNFLSVQNLLQNAQHLRLIEGVRMVKVEQALVGFRLFGGCQFAIETILTDANDLRMRGGRNRRDEDM